MAQANVSFYVTPGSSATQSSVCGAAATCSYGVETFDSKPGLPFTTTFGGTPITGSYSGNGGYFVVNADLYGGTGGSGAYPVVFGSSYSVSLATAGLPGVNYFGLYISALDPANEVTFSLGGSAIHTFTYTDFQAAVGNCPGLFCGNPDGGFAGSNPAQQYFFANFKADPGTYFDQVTFNENGGGGFETDNHTVAYVSESVTPAPEPSSIGMGIFGAAIFGGVLLNNRRKTKTN